MVSAESQAALDAARKAVADFMAKAGRHNTTVHERIAPAVLHETITKKTHEEDATVIDREVHADHFHLSVQPISDEETLEEQHTHNLLPVEVRTFEHDDREEVERRLSAEEAKFRDELVLVEGEKTQTTIPVLTGEHIHHHVHELIQPVINKQTIEPVVIHTTIQIHEIHHNAAQHHATSALPVVSMAEFKRQGRILTGREERYDFFEGEPRSVGGSLGSGGENAQRTGAQQSSAQGNQQRTNSGLQEQRTTQPDRRGSLADRPNDDSGSRSTGDSSQGGQAAPPAPPAPPMPSQPGTPQQSHWSLLPPHLARSAAGAGVGPHPPTGTPQLLRPGRAADQRQGSVARPGQANGQQQGHPSGL